MREPGHDSADAANGGSNADAGALARAILGFNRHALLVERHRELLERFRAAQATFTVERALYEARRGAAAEGAASRAAWQAHRQSCALYREAVRAGVRRYVHALRDEGLPPQRVLDAVKARLLECASADAPPAPYFEARALESDICDWAVGAYFEAA